MEIKEQKYRIVGANCCDKCKWLNGKVYKVRLAKIGVNHPPFIPGCRCKVELIENSLSEVKRNGKVL